MSEPMLYPLTFTPVLRDYMWGGRRLETLYGRRLPPGIIAESWEISAHPHGSTVADAGYWQGQPLSAIQETLGLRLVGARGEWALARRKFPLLVKLLDAQQNLSVQVHPNDAYAQAHENGELGKTEMWYILHAEPQTELVLGLRPGVDRAAFQQAAEAGALAPLLQREAVRPGQVFDVPAGTVHALCAGAVVAEIQQNSDTTYRIYDWDRLDPDGRPRALHLARAWDVIDFSDHPTRQSSILRQAGQGVTRLEVVRNRYFVVEEVTLTPDARYAGNCNGETLEIWGCVAGQAAIEWAGAPVTLPAIRFALLPAALGAFQVAAARPSVCLRVYLSPA
jgi:mannose-6-phosphate isomerase